MYNRLFALLALVMLFVASCCNIHSVNDCEILSDFVIQLVTEYRSYNRRSKVVNSTNYVGPNVINVLFFLIRLEKFNYSNSVNKCLDRPSYPDD